MKECSLCFGCYEDSVLYCPRDEQKLEEVLPWPLIIDGKYQIESLIGRGGMSAVYRATQLELARAVAIKILLPKVNDANALERMRREALASVSINHPNVVTIYDYGTLPNGSGYLVMRLLRGYALSKEIHIHKQLSFERAFGIIMQACSAIEAAHNLGIVHCDLKPDNIILEETEIGEIVQILDFGIAKLLKQANEELNNVPIGLSLGNIVLGTPLYMSPEQCQSREVDFRTDIYSLGIILYEMLTGSVPFSGQTAIAIARQHISDPILSPLRLRKDITPKVEQVILTALAKDREQRQQSAAQLMEELIVAATELSTAGLLDMQALPTLIHKRSKTRFKTSSFSSFSSEDQPTLRIEVNQSTALDTNKITINSHHNRETGTNENEPWSITSWQEEPLSEYKVLIVDDEPDIILLLKVIIESVGCHIITANNGKNALALIKESPPDLIISDVMMPDMDGYQLHQALKSDPEWSLIPIIFLTARVQQQEKLQALTMGIDDYWTKPFDAAEIRVRVQSILRRLNRLKKWEEKP